MPPLGDACGDVAPLGRLTVMAIGAGPSASLAMARFSMTPASLPPRLDCRSAAVRTTPARSREKVVELV